MTDPDPDPAGDDANVGLAVRYAMRAFTRALSASAAAFDLTSAEFRLLRTLSEEPAGSHAELAAAAAMDRPYVTSLVKHMVGRGLLVTAADTGDRRRSRVTMTAAGRQVLTALAAEADEVNDAATAGIPPAELRAFLGTLRRIRANLELRAGTEPAPVARAR